MATKMIFGILLWNKVLFYYYCLTIKTQNDKGLLETIFVTLFALISPEKVDQIPFFNLISYIR